MWACFDSNGYRHNDWDCSNSLELDEETEEAEEWKEIESELFSQIHHYSEELEDASSTHEITNSVLYEDPRKLKPLLRKIDEHNKDYHCGICREVGHVSRDCCWNREICVLCGVFGHLQQQCPSVFCYICKLPGHLNTECPSIKKTYVTCYQCHVFGLPQFNCPDLWRQFRYTSTRGPLIIDSYLINEHVYCCSCGEKGHYGYACPDFPMTLYAYSTYPLLVGCGRRSGSVNQKKKSKSAKRKRSQKKL